VLTDLGELCQLHLLVDPGDDTEPCFGEGLDAYVATGEGPLVVLPASTAPTSRRTADRLGKMPTTSVRRRISG